MKHKGMKHGLRAKGMDRGAQICGNVSPIFYRMLLILIVVTAFERLHRTFTRKICLKKDDEEGGEEEEEEKEDGDSR